MTDRGATGESAPARGGAALAIGRPGAGVLAIALLVVAAPARADLLPSIKARSMFDQVLRPGRLAAIEVTVDNPGISLRGTISVGSDQQPSVSERTIDVPRGTHKSAILYYQVGPYESDLSVELRAVSQIALASAEVSGTVVPPNRTLAVMVGPESWGLGGHAHDELAVTIAHVDASNLPDRWFGWDSADVVLWPEESGRPATAEQEEALLSWTRLGGHLVVAVGGDGRGLGRLREALPADVEAGGSESQSAIVAALTGDRSGAGTDPVPVSVLAPRAVAQVLARLAGGGPLVVEGPYGAGRVTLLAFDPKVALRNVVAGRDGMLARVLALPTFPEEQDRSYYGAGPLDVAGDFVGEIPPMRPISLSFLLLFMAAYVLVVGPLDYIVLKRLGRMTLTWVTYPLAIVIFSAIAYTFTSFTKGNEMVVTSVAVTDGVAGQGTSRSTSVTGIFAVERGRYAVGAVDPGGLVSFIPSGPDVTGAGFLLGSDPIVTRDDGRGTTLTLPINIYSLRRVLSFGPGGASPRPVPLEVDVASGGGSDVPAGWHDLVVRNVGGARLHEVLVVGPDGRFVALGDLAAGESRALAGARPPLLAAATIHAGLGGIGWGVGRRERDIVSVSRARATALGLSVTLASNLTGRAFDRWARVLDLSAWVERGGYVAIAHSLENEPGEVTIDGRRPRSQKLVIWRLVVPPALAGSPGPNAVLGFDEATAADDEGAMGT